MRFTVTFTVTSRSSTEHVEADEHRVEGLFHVFRATATVMGRPRVHVVRRLPGADVLSVEAATSAG